MFEIITGNLLDLIQVGNPGYVAHGCNCQHTMGSGFALALSSAYPEVLEVDREYSVRGDVNKLGHYTKAYLSNGWVAYNLYTQYYYGPARYRYFQPDSYASALQNCLSDIPPNSVLHIPAIGSGSGGSELEIVTDISAQIAMQMDRHIVMVVLPK